MLQDKPSLTLVRWINAPPAKVYAALTDPQKILRWWGPDAGPTVSATADVRPGGGFRVVFRTEDGQEHTTYGVYREVVPGEKLVFTWHWLETTERESLVTVRLKALNGGTELTLIHAGFDDDETRDSHRDGWSGALDKLEALLLTAGTRLGPYEIQSALGAGGMGEVYRGRDTTLNRDVALKVLPALFAADPDRLPASSAKRRCSPRSIIHISRRSTGSRTPGAVHALVLELV